MQRRNKAFLILTIVVIVLCGVFFLVYQKSSLRGYDSREKIGNTPCSALLPECGYCAGKQIGDYCYYENPSPDRYNQE